MGRLDLMKDLTSHCQRFFYKALFVFQRSYDIYYLNFLAAIEQKKPMGEKAQG